MNKVSLLEACNITTGKLDSNDAVENGNYPFFTCSPTPLKTDCYAFDEDAILLAGNNASGNFHCNRYNGKFNAYQRTYVITTKKDYDIDYVYYTLKYSLQHFSRLSQGSQTKFLTIKILNSFKINKIPLEVQKKQISILKYIDNKINLNQKIIENLSNLAKDIYYYWFVQFDFPNEEGRPYKSSGGKMVWNNELKRNVPEGWEVCNLYKIAEFINGLACQNYRPKNNEDYLPVIKIKEMHTGISDNTEYVTANIPKKYIIENGDILFSWSACLEVMFWFGGKGGLNQHIFKVKPKLPDSINYLYYQLSDYIEVFKKIADARKTTMGHITTDHLNQSKIVLSKQKYISDFENKTKNIRNKIKGISEENLSLTDLKQFLLPIIMNGQVSNINNQT